MNTQDLKFLTVAAVVALSLGLAGCGSSGSGTTMAPDSDPEPEPTAYEMALTKIEAATTADEAQMAYDAVDLTAVSGDEAKKLQVALERRLQTFADDRAAMARQALVDAAMCDAATAECVAAHDALIAALQADVAALAEDEDATNAQQAAAQKALDDATAKRNEVQMAREDFDRTTETGMKVGAAIDAANGLEEDRSADAITAAKVAIEEAEEAIGEDDDSYNERIMMAKADVARAEERNAVDMAIMDARTAIEGLAADADGDAVAAVQKLLTDAKMEVDGSVHLTEAEEASHTKTIADLQVAVTLAQKRVDADKMRMAEEEQKAKDAKNAAMAATAAKLYAGIHAPAANATGTGTDDVHAAYNDADSPDSGTTADTLIMVTIGTGGDTPAAGTPVALSEDKKTSVTANHGWAGKRYIDAAGGDSYEAVVYSNVESPKQGRKFGSAADVTDTGAYEYMLTDGALVASDLTATGAAARIALPSVTRTAGTESFELPDPNPEGVSIVNVSGRYHGVAGTYRCATTAGTACTAEVAADGFTLGGGTAGWTFTPSNAEARVMSEADTAYASYGWWIKKAANDGAFTASAFVDEKGTVAAATDLDDLKGTATYRGGAAGKYALASSTGGTNDAGHFTARATLEADFTNNADPMAITGTLDMFMGADGEARDWSVKLNGSAITDAGGIGDAGAMAGTEWTIGGTAAADKGQWSGTLRNNGDDDVPQVATGTFYTEYGTAGKMVGAFGANKQQ